MMNRITEGSIKAWYNSVVSEITPGTIRLDTPEGVVELENDFVLALTGYMPDFDFLEQLGINLSDDIKRFPEYNPDTMETNVGGLYLAGVICGGMETHKWFIENSRIHAPMIIDSILQNKKVQKQLR
jgi:thioredoxin reductase (NADPH)